MFRDTPRRSVPTANPSASSRPDHQNHPPDGTSNPTHGRQLAVLHSVFSPAQSMKPHCAERKRLENSLLFLQDDEDSSRRISRISDFAVSPASWAVWDKTTAENNKVMERSAVQGTILAFGDDQNLMHQPVDYTNDNWFLATSFANHQARADTIAVSAKEARAEYNRSHDTCYCN